MLQKRSRDVNKALGLDLVDILLIGGEGDSTEFQVSVTFWHLGEQNSDVRHLLHLKRPLVAPQLLHSCGPIISSPACILANELQIVLRNRMLWSSRPSVFPK